MKTSPIRQALIIGIVAAAFTTVGLAGSFLSSEPTAEPSPHAVALQLVFQTQQDRIREVDTHGWHNDNLRRDWSVQRPEAGDGVDTSTLFVVSYRIDGVEVCAWFVDTANQKVLPIEKEDEAEL